MKHIFLSGFSMLLLFTGLAVNGQNDKSKRPSPPVTVTQKVGETTITVTYSQPSVKGRTIGVDLEPMSGKVWRAGANEATVFEADKDIVVAGKVLPKGKYGFFILVQEESWVLIFNKTWNQWGAYDYKKADDALKVTAKATKAATFAEKMTFVIAKDGTVQLLWGDNNVQFKLD